MRMTPRLLELGLNVWPPLLGAGIRVTEIAPDWTSATTDLVLNRLTRSYAGTAFGGRCPR